MTRRLIRIVSLVTFIGVAVLVTGLLVRANVTPAHREEIPIESFSWGLSQGSFLRICMSNVGTTQSSDPRENISFIFVRIQGTLGDMILERSLSVPQGQFRCTDFSHPDLITAGLVPEPSSRVQFVVNVGATQGVTVGAAQTPTFGSSETITVSGGNTETYKTIQARQITVVQDL